MKSHLHLVIDVGDVVVTSHLIAVAGHFGDPENRPICARDRPHPPVDILRARPQTRHPLDINCLPFP